MPIQAATTRHGCVAHILVHRASAPVERRSCADRRSIRSSSAVAPASRNGEGGLYRTRGEGHPGSPYDRRACPSSRSTRSPASRHSPPTPSRRCHPRRGRTTEAAPATSAPLPPTRRRSAAARCCRGCSPRPAGGGWGPPRWGARRPPPPPSPPPPCPPPPPARVPRPAHDEGEVATARAAKAAGTVMILSTFATRSVEEVCATGACVWFQLYPLRDRGATRALVERAVDAGAQAIVLTVDMPVLGKRESDISVPLKLPPGVRYAHLADGTDTVHV